MPIRCISRDYCSLPLALLSAAKEQMRVEFDRDDEFILTTITRAISEIESVVNITIFESTYLWDPGACYNASAFYEIPYVPVLELGACNDSMCDNWTDITNEIVYRDSTHSPMHAFLNKKNAGLMRLVVGYRQLSCLPPALVSAILLQTGSLYENREAIQYGAMNALPDMVSRMLAGLWRPSV